MKRITQNKRANNIQTPKDPTSRNRYRKLIKGKNNRRFIKTARIAMAKRS
jgi:hypothetical protein